LELIGSPSIKHSRKFCSVDGSLFGVASSPIVLHYMAAIIVAMMACTLILSMMIPGHQEGPRPDMIIGGIPFTMNQISD
jgi:hypothetical protein